MEVESKIYGEETISDAVHSGFYDFKLLSTTAYAMLYRASKAGKHFLIKTTKDNTEHQQAMLRREYELSIGCDHSHIVHIYTFEENLPIGESIIMEYIEGCTLAEYLAYNPSKADRIRIFEELLSAVDYLHKRGVIHNDLKPENILVTRTDKSIKLIDFGLADNDAHFALRTLGCTPHYASPELRVQNQNIDARSDIYSIGILMGAIFGNRHRRIADRCRHRDPDRRYANVTALMQAWAHRNRLYRVVLGFVASLLFILPLTLLGQSKFTEYNKTKAREQLLTQIERDVDEIYTIVADSISCAVYKEFACNNIVSFWTALAEYQQKNIASIADPELNTVATTVFTLAMNRCDQKLMGLVKDIPMLPREEMSAKEIMFYDSLLAGRKPYQPYSAE